MIIEKIEPHPDIPGVARQVKVVRIDRIDYAGRMASILIQVDHLGEDGELHPYLGSFSAFMTSSNAKFVNSKGDVVEADVTNAIGEFDWLEGAIDAGTPLHPLIRAMIQRNAKRGNFNNNNFRD